MNQRDAKRYVCGETAWWLETVLPCAVPVNDPDDAKRVVAAALELRTELLRRAGAGQRPVDERQLHLTL